MTLFNFRRKTLDANILFSNHYVDVKALYVQRNNSIPCICFIGETDIDKAFDFIVDRLKAEIIHVYQHYYYDHDNKSRYFNNCIFVLDHGRMIELQQHYCHVLHTARDYKWATALVDDLAQFRIAPAAPVHTTIIGFARQADMN